jgi:beta-glucosidase
MTFPVKYEDTPSAKNWIGTPADDPTSVTYEEGVYVGYRYFNTFK